MDTSERRFEDEIEYWLTHVGPSEFDLYESRPSAGFDKQLGLYPQDLLDFVRETQPQQWERLERIHGAKAGEKFCKRVARELDRRGVVEVLRRGVEDLGARFKLVFFAPGSDLNELLAEKYWANRLTVVRQLQYSTKNTNSVDTVLFVNGIPVVTMELKNQLTGQTYRDAVDQYKRSRPASEVLFGLNRRAVVHFAVDTDQVWMTTKLAGMDTVFLPFNRGFDNGAGNPPVPGKYKTSYLWEEVLAKDSLLDILHRFVQFIPRESDRRKDKLIFPRYHQLDAVRALVADAKIHGAGKNYLVQHSAGSGKSNTIAWLAHHLSNLHDDQQRAVFDSIIVITDRRVLDKQLQDTIYAMDHTAGVVVRVDKNARQLTEALADGAKIIISTLQKFPFVDVSNVATTGKRFAVIVDEAHSSQTGEASEKLKQVLADTATAGKESEEDLLERYAAAEAQIEGEQLEVDEQIAEELRTQGRQQNLSFFAFTATPKQKTLEIFGTPVPDATPRPYHVYSMRQAIEEGFILDVLKNYTTYQTYYRVGKTTADDPEYSTKQANKALGKYLSLHPYNLRQKAEIIIEHFLTNVAHKIGGNAKAMLVTGSRLHAVRYYFAFRDYIAQKGYTDLGVLVAFSGTVEDEGAEYTEEQLNQIPEAELPERFATGEYQLLLVAEKYQTGFDQPLLHTMYVDKKLHGVKAVQTLSRINRMHPGKTDTFVLDFVNSAEDIQKSFQDYYISTGITEETDPNIVYDLYHFLASYHLWTDKEIEGFAKVFFTEQKKQTNLDFSKLNAYLDPAVGRFNELDEEDKLEVRARMNKFTRNYDFLTHIIRYDDERLHRFAAYARLLVRKLHIDGDPVPSLEDEVALQYYRLQQVYEGSIDLADEEGELSNNPDTGGASEDERETLSNILSKLNDRWGTEFTHMDKVIEQLTEDMVDDPEVQSRARNSLDMFAIVYDERIKDIVLERMNQNQDFAIKYLSDPQFKADIDRVLLPLIHDRLNRKE
ncbi:type I restriction endonuclease subunit R [Corynebacterium amycolatum]|uniref:type I restriction endonuclease subunit R n=1 Tax=Corynebacterium amycolatum TaxID=43765 RepID=UPI00254B677A|nr:type I restriction endonuclease [Corynebacterium amycolatum]MDK7200413.1 type I restriction endonuclease [Corynebacterium amycolatum]